MAPTSSTASAASGPGRPTLYTEAFLARLFDAIRLDGLSDNAAAAQVGLHRSTMARWKHQHPELELRLGQAREEFRHEKLALIHAGGRGWRAAAWMLERIFPADYHPRAIERDRFQKLAQSEIPSEPVSQNSPADAVVVAVESVPSVPSLPASQNSPATLEQPAPQPLSASEPMSQNPRSPGISACDQATPTEAHQSRGTGIPACHSSLSAEGRPSPSGPREKHLSRKARRALERAQSREQRRQAAGLAAAAA